MAFYDKDGVQFLVCLLCRSGFSSLNSVKDHFLKSHNLKGIKYDKAKQILQNSNSLQGPEVDTVLEPYPFLRIQQGIRCSHGHISISKRNLKVRKCCQSDCQCEALENIVVQEIGRKRIKISDERDQELQGSMGILCDERFLNGITALEEGGDAAIGSRKTRPIETVIEVDKIFPRPRWNDEAFCVS
jgi:hypothetical protein